MRSRCQRRASCEGRPPPPSTLTANPSLILRRTTPLQTIGHAPVARNQPDRPRDAASGANTQAVSRVRASGNVMDTRRTEVTTSETRGNEEIGEHDERDAEGEDPSMTGKPEITAAGEEQEGESGATPGRLEEREASKESSSTAERSPSTPTSQPTPAASARSAKPSHSAARRRARRRRRSGRQQRHIAAQESESRQAAVRIRAIVAR